MTVDPNAQRSIDEQNVYIRDTLMSIAAKYGEVLKDAVEDAFDSAEVLYSIILFVDLCLLSVHDLNLR